MRKLKEGNTPGNKVTPELFSPEAIAGMAKWSQELSQRLAQWEKQIRKGWPWQ